MGGTWLKLWGLCTQQPPGQSLGGPVSRLFPSWTLPLPLIPWGLGDSHALSELWDYGTAETTG